MRIRLLFFTCFLLITNFLFAQRIVGNDYIEYINKYKWISIREMELYHIPASITLAQGMIESGCGKSTLAIGSMNHFGIKCKKDWTGDTYYHDDDAPGECFRKYNNVDESFRDHSLFLSTSQRYSGLFKLEITDYKGWAYGLKQAGYATNPDYANILIRAIEKYELYLLDAGKELHTKEIALDKPKDREKIDEYDNNRTAANYVNIHGHILFRKNYRMPDVAKFEYLYTSELGRKVYQNYNVPFIFAREGDTWFSIAKEFKIYSFQVYKQNDLQAKDLMVTGQIIYLESKKRKNNEKKYVVRKGDSMYSIAQEKCIKLQSLLKYNKLKVGEEPLPGDELKLKRF